MWPEPLTSRSYLWSETFAVIYTTGNQYTKYKHSLSKIVRLVGITSYKTDLSKKKTAKIRNQYNQVSHLTQDTTWESDKIAIRHHKHDKQEPRGQPFRNRWPQGSNEQTWKHDKHKTNDPQKKYRLGTVCKNILLEGLNKFHGANLALKYSWHWPLTLWSYWWCGPLVDVYTPRSIIVLNKDNVCVSCVFSHIRNLNFVIRIITILVRGPT